MGWCEFHEQRGWANDYCLKKDDYIGSDVSREYCRYDGRGCPIKESRSSSGGCYLTTACVECRGLPDDCDELTVLRGFRDTYMANLPEGEAEIKEYYSTAPSIVKMIDDRPDRKTIYDSIYSEVILPCVELIKKGEYEEAHRLYRKMVVEFKEN